jgi:hypothetical protein
MAINLVQNIKTHNMKKKIHNYLKNALSKKMWHPPTNFNSILPTITKDNNILELQGFLKHNDFISKPIVTNAILIYIQLALLNKK